MLLDAPNDAVNSGAGVDGTGGSTERLAALAWDRNRARLPPRTERSAEWPVLSSVVVSAAVFS